MESSNEKEKKEYTSPTVIDYGTAKEITKSTTAGDVVDAMVGNVVVGHFKAGGG